MRSTNLPKLQIVVLGSPAVGKTCFIDSFCNGYFEDSPIATVPIEISKKIINLNDNIFNLCIVEGKSPYNKMFENIKHSLLSAETKAVIIMCDLSNKNAMEGYQAEIEACINEMQHCKGNPIKIVIGSKYDSAINENNQLLKKLAEDNGLYYKTSNAKDIAQVNELFNEILQYILEANPIKESSINQETLSQLSFLSYMNIDRGEKDEEIQVSRRCILY